jgi:hypothetical protein
MTAIGWRAATASLTGSPVSGAGTVTGVGIGVGLGVGDGVAVGVGVAVCTGVAVAAGWLACAIGEPVGVAACPPMDVATSAMSAAPTATAPTAPAVVVRFTG